MAHIPSSTDRGRLVIDFKSVEAMVEFAEWLKYNVDFPKPTALYHMDAITQKDVKASGIAVIKSRDFGGERFSYKVEEKVVEV